MSTTTRKFWLWTSTALSDEEMTELEQWLRDEEATAADDSKGTVHERSNSRDRS